MSTGPWSTGVLLGALQSSELVFDSNPSHLEGHPTVRPYLAAALQRTASLGRERIYEEIDFDRCIGVSNCVHTGPADEIVYAQRKNRIGLTRFVRNRVPEPCSSVVIVLVRLEQGGYVLRTAFIGNKTPMEPWDPESVASVSLPFWNAHALVWGHAEIVPGTETTECPWQ